jgi:hypothetical protein
MHDKWRFWYRNHLIIHRVLMDGTLRPCFWFCRIVRKSIHKKTSSVIVEWSKYGMWYINFREYQRDNQKWTIQRNWQQDEEKQSKNTTQYVLDTTMHKRNQSHNSHKLLVLEVQILLTFVDYSIEQTYKSLTLGHVGHVTYSFINILFISTGIFDK